MLRNSLFILDCCWRCSITKSSQTLCDPTDCSTPDFSWSLLRFMSIELVVPSNYLILCHPFLLLPSIFPSIRGLFQWVGSLPQVAKASQPWLQCQSFQWIFRVNFLSDWLIWSPCSPRDSQESSPTPQFKSISSSALSLLYGPALTSIHDYWKNHSFDYYMDLCWQSDVAVF